MSQTITNTTNWSTNASSIINSTNSNNSYNYSNVWDPPDYDPWQPSVIAGPAVVITTGTYYSNYYWDWFWAYLIILLFLVLALILAKLAARRRQLSQQQAALQRRARQAAAGGTANTTSADATEAQTKTDLPPAYDEVMNAYINGKLDGLAAEERSIAFNNGMSQGVSTLTILTEIDANPISSDLSVTTIATTEAAACQDAPPNYNAFMANSVDPLNGFNK